MNANDSAFPAFNSTETYKTGLTKRELFAAMAMQGLLANPERPFANDKDFSSSAVRKADALIEELSKEQK